MVFWGPYHKRYFARHSNSMENSPCCNSTAVHQIATMFCTCHDRTAVVPCTKFCSNHYIKIEARVKRNFHRSWIVLPWNGSSLVQVMAFRLFRDKMYLDKSWRIWNRTLTTKFLWNQNQYAITFIQEKEFGNRDLQTFIIFLILITIQSRMAEGLILLSNSFQIIS